MDGTTGITSRSLVLKLRADGPTLAAIKDLQMEFDWACEIVRGIARKANTRHQAALHALAYRAICPQKTTERGLPSGYATRAISRVSLGLKLEDRKEHDPTPPRSIDLDHKTLSLDPVMGEARITGLDSRGRRGGAALGERLAIQMILTPEERAIIRESGRVRGGTLELLKGHELRLTVRLAPPESAK